MKQTSILILLLLFFSCKKENKTVAPAPPVPEVFSLAGVTINNLPALSVTYNVTATPVISFGFTAPVNRATANTFLLNASGVGVGYVTSFEKGDSMVILQPVAPLLPITKYILTVSSGLTSKKGTALNTPATTTFVTAIDSSDKFPRITDTALIETVQKQTFRYFWDFAHPVSGLARERNTSGDLVTSGGSGFGIMALITGMHRNFISKTEGLAHLQKMVSFLKGPAKRFHGAFPHWLNGATGNAIPFSTKDNGADLVETSYLMQGLLCARQYFNGNTLAEQTLRNGINEIYNAVEWDWFRKGNEDVLYWHWSPDYQWDLNVPIKGWNECLITYVLASSSSTHAISKTVYDKGWAGNGAMKNGAIYYSYPLPLGPPLGGPLFFEHYSFLGINPNSLTDAYANYETQVKAHTKINYAYCVANPKGYYGYSADCWGLTASDVPNGYAASSPANDLGVIAPTAALSSFPYTPTESMKALQFFYYKLGDKLWGEYGFKDAFNLSEPWFASSYLAIDQGPIIVMMENYRSGLLWNLFMSCPEIKTGMTTLGFQSPHL